MFVVFVVTANIFTHEFNIAKRLLFRENLSNGLSANNKVYTLEMYLLYSSHSWLTHYP